MLEGCRRWSRRVSRRIAEHALSSALRGAKPAPQSHPSFNQPRVLCTKQGLFSSSFCPERVVCGCLVADRRLLSSGALAPCAGAPSRPKTRRRARIFNASLQRWHREAEAQTFSKTAREALIYDSQLPQTRSLSTSFPPWPVHPSPNRRSGVPARRSFSRPSSPQPRPHAPLCPCHGGLHPPPC